ncbi:hypothetical protein BpHYR1_025522 [Brachionus plicatilis]|uniref:Uncharacterized protein n=1 Tax=Brachionus plicatilis TaxID=10195 RepID=A0A3M7RBX0_BRAPC|nr:hypothetical protein BpHYR1_025522 [Brachionus plicatilis]
MESSSIIKGEKPQISKHQDKNETKIGTKIEKNLQNVNSSNFDLDKFCTNLSEFLDLLRLKIFCAIFNKNLQLSRQSSQKT